MEITLNVPEGLGKRIKALSDEERDRLAVEALEKTLSEKDSSFKEESAEEKAYDNSPWANLDIEDIACESGKGDLAINHDHYLYGTKKRVEE